MATRINSKSVLLGGVLAGVAIVCGNIAAQFVLGERVQRDMNAWIPGAADRLQADSAAIAVGVVMKLAIGVIMIWLYAAVRPRLGSGAAIASLIAVAVWLLGAIFFSDYPLTGLMSWSTYAWLEAMQLMAFVAAALAGAWVYRER
jgi:hypothetical protein